MKVKLETSINNTVDNVVFGNSTERNEELEILGIKKQDPKFNSLLGQCIDDIYNSDYIINVLTYNGEFAEVEPTTEAVKGYFSSMFADMERIRKTEKRNGTSIFYTEFKPSVKQIGELLIFNTINSGYEAVTRYYLPVKQIEKTGSNYLNMIYCRNKNGQGLKGIFKFNSNLINSYTDNKTVLLDSELYLKNHLTKEEKEYLRRVKEDNGKSYSFEEVLNFNEYNKEVKYILESNNSFGVNEINTEKELKNYLSELQIMKEEEKDQEELYNIDTTITFIKNMLYDELEESGNLFFLDNGNLGEHKELEDLYNKGQIIGVSGNRNINLAYPRKKINEYLKQNPQYTALICGGAKGVDTAGIIEAVKAGLKVFIVSPTINSESDLTPVIKAVKKQYKGDIEILKLHYEEEETKKQYKERNNIISIYSNILLYSGDIGKTGTGQTVRLCKKNGTKVKEL